VLHCSSGVRAVGIPAECERMVLTQLEYRGDLEVNWNFSEWNNGSHYLGSWVVFVDAGRGWLVGPEAPGGTMTYSRGTIPPLSTWRTDVGLGMDFDAVGVYVAKAVGGADKLPPNFFIRLTKRSRWHRKHLKHRGRANAADIGVAFAAACFAPSSFCCSWQRPELPRLRRPRSRFPCHWNRPFRVRDR
jgi:hypothetical protein